MLTVVFPGQGSQQRGMGRALFDGARDLERRADDVLGFSIRELCVADPMGRLSDTRYAQPAIYVVNALSFLERQRRGGEAPQCAAGHSLGEYNALFVAGCFDFETGLRLVKRRGELMSAVRGGGMAAVVGLSRALVEEALQTSQLASLDLANINTPRQMVVAGPRDVLSVARDIFERRGATFVELDVSAPFHSRYMADVASAFGEYLRTFDLRDPQLPVISNVTGARYAPGTIKPLLERQLRERVEWCASMQHVLRTADARIEEVGHGQVLTRMMAQIRAVPKAQQAVPRSSAEAEVTPTRPAPRPRQMQAVDVGRDPRPAPTLGSSAFRTTYGVRLSYAAGSMYRGIASEALVTRMARAGLLSFFGTGGLDLTRIRRAIDQIRAGVGAEAPFGVNLTSRADEAELVDLLLERRVNVVEASTYVRISEPLVRYRVAGIRRAPDGTPTAYHRIIGKVSRPEVAEQFLSPPPEGILRKLVAQGQVTPEQAAWAEGMPLADDLCIECDSGGHTDGGVAFVLLPSMIRLRDEIAATARLRQRVRIGAAGGIGTPEAVVGALMLGAEFVLTGSINQCTVEAGQSEAVKEMLATMDVQDTTYAPAGDMFEIGAQVQVLRRGVFFPARANRLRDLYRNFPSLDAIDAATRTQIEQTYFQQTFEEVFAEVVKYRGAAELERAARDPRHKMALVFKWYFRHTSDLALAGHEGDRVNYQVHCGPAMGALNRWLRGSDIAPWQKRHPDDLAFRLMEEASTLLDARLNALLPREPRPTSVREGAWANP